MKSEGLEGIADFFSSIPIRSSVTPLVESLPLPQCEVCVIVPVRDEAETIEQTLTALAFQTELNGKPLDANRFEVIVFANNCSDASAAIARAFANSHPEFVLHVVEKTLPPEEAYIGRVRQLLMDEAYHRLQPLGRRRVIASTDGDSQVSSTWIAATLDEIERGADAVGGRILTDRAGRAALSPYSRACFLHEVGYRYLIAELEAYLDPDPYDPLPRHFQHYGASLAVTTEMYALAGGLPAVRSPEDVAFYQALRRVNARFRHSPRVRVTTSARQQGRTPQGLANQLNKWSNKGQSPQLFSVEPAGAMLTRFQVRHQLRALWLRILNGYLPTRKEVTAIAQTIGISTQWLIKELSHPGTFGPLFERIEIRQQEEKVWPNRWPLVPVKQAIQDLRLCLAELRREHPMEADEATLTSFSAIPSALQSNPFLLGHTRPQAEATAFIFGSLSKY